MARSGYPDSAGSQFFIMVDDAPHLDGNYAAFGKVLSGMDTVDAIVAAPRDGGDKPRVELVMASVTADTFGVVYDEPQNIMSPKP
jgi:peptidyl-prolyl cis-trans isomerase B (cyclophilin B)